MFYQQFSTRLSWPILLITNLALLALACNSSSLLSEQPTATPTAALSFEVVIQGLVSPTPILPTPLPLSTPALQPTSVLPVATPLPLPSPLATLPLATAAPPEFTPVPQPAGATPLPANPVETSTPSPMPVSGDGVYTGNITDQIVLLSPDPAFTLPAGADQLEFKWMWFGQELRPCQLPEGYGFEVRIWPSQAEVPAEQRASVQPLGVIDAVQEQPIIAANCDLKTKTRRYTVNYLKQTPGVKQGGGSGQFFWDVAYIQLKPYYNLMVSAPRDFFIPPSGPEVPTPTPAPPTPVAYALTPGPRPQGTVVLLNPQGKPVFPVNAGPVEFRWRWEGEGAGCQLPPNYGFEVRIWSTQPGFTPLGLFDAARGQTQIKCDPGSGIYSYIAPNLTAAPGVKATYIGDYRWDGQFLWDAVLVSTNPYRPPESAPPPGSFEISLSPYTGPFDPFGAPLKCDDFPSWIEAQAVFLAADPAKDPHKLDPDGNKIACDELRQ